MCKYPPSVYEGKLDNQSLDSRSTLLHQTSTHMYTIHLEVTVFALSHCVHGLTRKIWFTCALSCVMCILLLTIHTNIPPLPILVHILSGVSSSSPYASIWFTCAVSYVATAWTARYGVSSSKKKKKHSLADALMRCLQRHPVHFVINIFFPLVRCLQRRRKGGATRPMPSPHVVHAPENVQFSPSKLSLLTL